MLTRVPEYFEQFHCLAGACPDTCCGQWAIVVDDAARERYLSVEGDLGDRICRALTQRDGETCMVLEQGRCPLLTEDGLCSIVLEKGEDFLSTTCHTHPRFTEIYGNLSETMLSVSCPEAARLLLEQKGALRFLTSVDDRPPDPNDLDPGLFSLILAARTLAFALVQDRDRPLTDRLALLLAFSRQLDRRLLRPKAAAKLLTAYADRDHQDRVLKKLRRRRPHDAVPFPGFLRKLLENTEHLTEQFPRLLERMEPVSLNSVPMEQLTVYYLFRWWLKAACSGYLWRQAAACVVSVMAVSTLSGPAGGLRPAASLYSKEVEHSEENLSLLRRRMDRVSLNRLLQCLEVSHAV